ncbi:MAG: leucine-rich repeat domain-containing protein, partial [Anaerovoracaceae bacterium]|nr:leucine-rich repeat domain-containing protein [Anaerovoracaceae bacterium]
MTNRKTKSNRMVLLMILAFAAAMIISGGSVKAAGEVEISSSNFPDKEFRQYVMAEYDENRDGILNDAEIELADEMDVDSMGIRSMEGIQFFANLENLSCEYNGLTKIDISKNTELKYVDLDNNKLKSVDFSKNKKLIDIDCDDNKLTDIDVSKNTEARDIDFSGNILMK